MNILLIFLGRLTIILSKTLNLGQGSTWPGHIALLVNKNFIKDIIKKNYHLTIILIAGTNGKTTTGKLIQTILEKDKKKVFQNQAGANLLNGIASSILLRSSIFCKINYDFAIFEIDENTLPLILKELNPNYIILLNLFRDQLDRYGEVNTIASKWGDALKKLSKNTTLILNADDPQIAYLGSQQNSKSLGADRNSPRGWIRRDTSVCYFGLSDKTLHQKFHQHAVDSTYCPHCGSKLYYNIIYYSHLGEWYCKKCNLKRPKLNIANFETYPLLGIHNRYNTNAAVLCAQKIGVDKEVIKKSLLKFESAFGRQESIEVKGKKVQIFLSKNPTSFNESLRTIKSLGAKTILFVLNDRIPDGRDVSWIWDVDFEDYANNFSNIIVSGDRCYDMGLRIKYAIQSSESSIENSNPKLKIYEGLKEAIKQGIEVLDKNETLYILPTYSAMLNVREILLGKKIL